jgi:hypothetical protein
MGTNYYWISDQKDEEYDSDRLHIGKQSFTVRWCSKCDIGVRGVNGIIKKCTGCGNVVDIRTRCGWTWYGVDDSKQLNKLDAAIKREKAESVAGQPVRYVIRSEYGAKDCYTATDFVAKVINDCKHFDCNPHAFL